MDNFNIRAYLAEGRLIKEEKDPTGILSKFSGYKPLIDLDGTHKQVTFQIQGNLQDEDFQAAKKHLMDQGYEVDQNQSHNDYMEDDDRDIYPRIIFKEKVKVEEKRPDYPDVDKDGDTEESMEKALKDKETSTAVKEGMLQDVEQSLNDAPIGSIAKGGGYSWTKVGKNSFKTKNNTLGHAAKVASQIGSFEDFIIKTQEKPEKRSKFKKHGEASGFDMRGINEEDAEGTNFDYDYADIGQFYLEGLNKPFDLTEDELKDLGESIVRNIYKGDIKAAYDAIVHNKGLEHIVKYSEPNDTYQVWLADEIVTDFATKEKADAEAKRLNALQEAEIEVDDTTEFKIELKHLLDKHTVKEDYYPSLRAYNVIDGDGNIVYKKLPRHTAIEKAGEREDYKFTATDSLAEDLDIGHQDNEPGMLKAELYHIGSYAMELYKMMDALEGQGEVDFPAWWQSKITTAKTMISGAKHYLEFELKEPAIEDMVDDLTVSSVELQELTPNELAGETKDGPNAYEGKMSHSSNKVEELKKAVLAKLSGK